MRKVIFKEVPAKRKLPPPKKKIHGSTRKDVFEDPNDSVGAEETTNLASAATSE